MKVKKSLPIIHDSHARRAFTMHDRLWRENVYVYPVVSRRSKGVSIGINMNPDKVCNYDCIYCNVDRTIKPVAPGGAKVDLERLRGELRLMLSAVTSGEIYQWDPFDKIPPELRRINDLAFSGDGEPTTAREFLPACKLAVEERDRADLSQAKIVVISNATMFQRPAVQEAFAFLDGQHGEIWAKLDAGTEAYFQVVDRSAIPLERILRNILEAARIRPLVIQTLFMQVHGHGPDEREIQAYIGRLKDILQEGGHIKLVQIYTVARQTTEAYATALEAEALERIAQCVRGAIPHLPVEVYP